MTKEMFETLKGTLCNGPIYLKNGWICLDTEGDNLILYKEKWSMVKYANFKHVKEERI